MTTHAATLASAPPGAALSTGFTRRSLETSARRALPAPRESTLPMIQRGSWLQQARRGERGLRRRIGRALARGGTGEKEARHYLGSFDAWAVAADRYNHDQMRQGKEPLRKAQLCALIAEGCGSVPIDEPVHAALCAKGSPDTDRVIFTLGPRRWLRQILAGNALEPFCGQLHPAQKLLQGGIGRAIHTIERRLEEGFEWAAEAVIQDMFGSFEQPAARHGTAYLWRHHAAPRWHRARSRGRCGGAG